MVELNESAIEYIEKLGYKDVVLDLIKYTT